MNFSTGNTVKIRNNFKTKESYLQFRKEWRAYHKSMVQQSRKLKSEVKLANRALSTAEKELGNRISYNFYTSLSDAQNSMRSSSSFMTTSFDICDLVRGNTSTRTPVSHYKADISGIKMVLGRLVADGVLSDFDAVYQACTAGINADLVMNTQSEEHLHA